MRFSFYYHEYVGLILLSPKNIKIIKSDPLYQMIIKNVNLKKV